ncbi:hypothetical protein ABEB36_012135 [Hypothenemus hampei]
MKRSCCLVIAFCAILTDAGQLISSYNLLTPPELIYAQQPSNLHITSVQPQLPAHPTVLAALLEESAVPNDLKKSNTFYGNPIIANALSEESLAFNKEMVVYDRPSERIDRQQIVKLINSLNRVHYE